MIPHVIYKSTNFSWEFSNSEKELIIAGLKKLVLPLGKEINKIKNDPKNEGQVKYERQIIDIQADLSSIEEIIQNLK